MDRMQTLNFLKKRRRRVIKCDPFGSCWCKEIDFRADVFVSSECLSPKELLETYSSQMSGSDRNILQTLSTFEFEK